MKRNISFIVLLLAVLITFITRFYKLGEIPHGLYVDEAGQGYSAYSLIKTGTDEFGKHFPIVFRSLTDFKTPLYIYMITPLIPIFGLSAFAVRFPSFLFSVLTLPILYYLIKHLTKRNDLAALSVILLAISPWHILFGRTNFECNVALFFLLSGVLAFYKSLKYPKILMLAAILFAIAIPAYHSQRIITPLTILFLGVRHYKILFQKTHLKYLLLGGLAAFVITLPTLTIINTPGFLARASGLNIFTHKRQMPDGFIYNYKGAIPEIINGSWFLTTREFFSLYFSYLSPRYMFFLGDYGPRSSFPELSTFFVWQFPFYLYGLFILIRKKDWPEFKYYTILSLLISPIPAALTRDPYTTIRSLPLVIPQIIIIAIGLRESYGLLKNKFFRQSAILGFIIVYIYSVFKLYSSVIILNEYYRAKAWDYGWMEVAQTISALNPDFPIIVDNARSDAYPQLAFYLKYDPEKYISDNPEVTEAEYYTNMYHNPEKFVGKIVTRPINWERDLTVEQYLVGDELGISLQQISEHNLKLVKQINYPDGTPAYRIVLTNPVYENSQRLLRSGKEIH